MGVSSCPLLKLLVDDSIEQFEIKASDNFTAR